MSIDTIEAYREKKKELDAAVKLNSKKWIAAVLKPHLEQLAAKGVTAIRWHQYTPYFNDGSPCDFGCYLEYYEVENGDDWLDQYDLDSSEREAQPDLRPSDAGGDDVFEAAFGDHAQVTAKLAKGGVEFTVHEYDHE